MKHYKLTRNGLSLWQELEETLEFLEEGLGIDPAQIQSIIGSNVPHNNHQRKLRNLYYLLTSPEEFVIADRESRDYELLKVGINRLAEIIDRSEIKFLEDEKVLEEDIDEMVWDFVINTIGRYTWLRETWFMEKKQDILESLSDEDKKELVRLNHNHPKATLSIVLLAMELTIDPETQN